jgi:exosortase
MSIAELPPTPEVLAPPPVQRAPREVGSSWLKYLPALIVLAAFLPMLVMHGVNLWSKPHYQFFPLVIIGSGALAYFAVQRQGRILPGRFQVAALALGFASLMGLAASAFLLSSFLAIVSFLVGLLAFIYSYGGWRLTKRLLPAWLFLWLAVPPPFNWDADFITWLKVVTAQWTSYVLDVFGILHVMQGNTVIVPPYSKLLVEEACSGIHSFFAIITCALFFVFWFGRPILHAILLLAGSVGWVLAANCARVVLIAVAQVRFGVDLAHGLRHDVLGMVIFLFLVGMVISLDRLLCFLFNSTYSFMALFKKGRMVLSRMAEAQKKKIDLGLTRWPGMGGTWVYAKPIVGIAVLLCAANYSLAALGLIEVARPSDATMVQALDTLHLDSLPPVINAGDGATAWSRLKFEVAPERPRDDKLGQFTRYWWYKHPNVDEQVTLSCDYTFYNWHDLTLCYRLNGWQMTLDKTHRPKLPNGEEDVYVEALFYNPASGQQGYLLFSLLDENGRVQAGRPTDSETLIENRLRRLREALERRPTETRFQLQLFATAYHIISEQERNLYRQLFLQYRSYLTRSYLAARQGGKP